MNYIVVDVEADGPCPGLYSMVSFGAVDVSSKMSFHSGLIKPISHEWVPEALAISNITRDEQLRGSSPHESITLFDAWVRQFNRPTFCSDNLAFDWQFINYYFHLCLKNNPFGFSGKRIGDIIGGLERNLRVNWKKLRKTKHDHNPVNDAMGNAEVFEHFLRKHGVY